MKKIVSLMLCMVLLSASAVSAFAATRQDLIDYAQDTIPEKYAPYHVWAENILGQYDLTAEQWDELLALSKELAAQFSSDEGQSLHLYELSQIRAAEDALDRFCEITGSTYLMRPAANQKHAGDLEVLLYKADGTLVATIDGDLYPDKTGEESGALWLVLSAVLLALSGAAVWFLRRRLGERA